MKQLLSLLTVVLLIATTSVAFAADYSSMTDEQLKEQFNGIRNELTIRGLVAEKKTIIFDQADIQIYISGDITIDKQYVWSETYTLFIPIVVVNNSSSNIGIALENSSVNGWNTDANDKDGSTPAGKKSKAYLYFELKNTDVEALEDFTDVEFTLRIYDSDTFKNIIKTEAITIYAVN